MDNEHKPMSREHALLIVEVLAIVTRTQGIEAALRLIDRWIDNLADEEGIIDLQLKQAAYDYVKSLQD